MIIGRIELIVNVELIEVPIFFLAENQKLLSSSEVPLLCHVALLQPGISKARRRICPPVS